jgi:SAM-dependent methyltransferase
MKSFYSRSLHRELLEKEIRGLASMVTGVVLDAGSKNRRYDSYFTNARKITAIDINPRRGDVLKADLLSMPFADSFFDTVISFETLEYVLDTKKAIDQVARVLKKDGLFIFSVPFLDPVHGDIDSVRYTSKGLRGLLQENFIVTGLTAFGGRYSLIWDFHFEKVRNSYSKLLRFLLLPFLFIRKKAALYSDAKENNQRFPMGYVCICRKKE